MSLKSDARFKTPWRDRYQEAAFRGVQFYVETDARQGGRRVAMHEYPKRNIPYAEDMGRKAKRFLVQGYLIGKNYWEQKNNLIDALEKDGPGMLRLPLPYKMSDEKVMVMSYTVTEARERGGFCTIEMDFVEYGDPQYRQQISTPSQIEDSAFKLEGQMIGPPKNRLSDEQVQVMVKSVYAKIHKTGMAGVRTTFSKQALMSAVEKNRPVKGFAWRNSDGTIGVGS